MGNDEQYESYSPSINGLLNPDGSITTLDGTVVSPASEEGAQRYRQSAPQVNKFINPDGSLNTLDEISGNGGSGGVTIEQTMGQNADTVMSQKAVTDSIRHPNGNPDQNVCIASKISVNSANNYRMVMIGTTNTEPETIQGNSVLIGATPPAGTNVFSTITGVGYDAQPKAVLASAFGPYSQCTHQNAVALGSYSRTSAVNTISVGSGQAADSSSYQYRRITNVANPTGSQDAATKGYVDIRVPAPPGTGTYVLKSVNGIASWVSE